MENKERTPRVISDATLDRYLCAILVLGERIPIVRSVDVAGHLGCSKACVSMAVKQMTREALVRVERHGALVLTDAGMPRAKLYLERLDFFRSLLARAGVGVDAAEPEAEAMTRALSEASYQSLRRCLADCGVGAPSL